MSSVIKLPGQWCKMYLAVLKPDTIFSAQVKTAASGVITQIEHKNGVGTPGNVLTDMVVLLGSTAGARDKGIARARKAANSTYVFIGAESGLNLSVDDHITVIEDFEISARHAVGNKMDVDIAYSNQHTLFEPIPMMGSHACLWLDPISGTVDFEPTAAGSWCAGSTISSYSWSAPGASATSGMTTQTPTITYDTAKSAYRVSLTVTAANGKSYTAHRFVFVFDANNMPLRAMLPGPATLDKDAGGMQFPITAYDDAEESDIKRRALCVLFSIDYYNNQEQYVGLSAMPNPDRLNVLTDGRIFNEIFYSNPEGGHRVEFTLVGSRYQAELASAFPLGLQDEDLTIDPSEKPPSNWSIIDGLTARKIITHIAIYRSTLARVVDIYCDDDTRVFDRVASIGSNIWSHLKWVADKLLARVSTDRFGRFFIGMDTNRLANRSGIPIVMDIDDAYWMDDLIIIRRDYGATAAIQLEGVFYNSGIRSQIGGLAPGPYPLPRGGWQNIGDCILGNQSFTNELAGLICGEMSIELESVQIPIAGNCKIIDVVPNQYVRLTTEHDVRDIDLVNRKLIPQRITWTYDANNHVLWTLLECQDEGGAYGSVKIIYPEGDEGDVGPLDPPEEPPDPPDPPELPPADEDNPPEDEEQEDTIIVATVNDIRIATNFGSGGSTSWTSKLGVLTGGIKDADNTGQTVWVVSGDGKIWRNASLSSGTWLEIFDITTDFEYTDESDTIFTYDDYDDMVIQRIICASATKAYALVVAQMGSTALSFILKTLDGGATWGTFIIDSRTGDNFPEYEVSTHIFMGDYPNGYDTVYQTTSRLGIDPGAGVNPLCIAMKSYLTDGGYAALTPDSDYQDPPDTAYIVDGTGTPSPTDDQKWQVKLSYEAWVGGLQATVEGYLDERYGSGNWRGHTYVYTMSMPNEEARIRLGVVIQSSGGAESYNAIFEVFWNGSTYGTPHGFDIGKSADNTLYVGLPDKIVQSEDGGATWIDYITEHGAFDIHCPLAQSGDANITYLATDLKIYKSWRDNPNNAITSAEVDNSEIPLRITTDPQNENNILALRGNAVGVFDLMNRIGLASWIEKVSDISGARSIRIHSGFDTARRYFYLDAGGIWLCTTTALDTWVDQKGDWSSYGGPVRIMPT